ncbi:MAG TPA: peptidoglycan-binding domain-containing protein [Falsiroseomonas sp.]|nr:peptidoglycan-binding domain-containing protein [Falsiroseomonas sp.]
MPVRRSCLVLLVAAFAAGPTVAQQQQPPLSFVQPLSPNATTAVQERLRDAGVYMGDTDGVWGPNSQAALDRFQAARGLAVTGSLNVVTARALGIEVGRLLPMPEPEAAATAPVAGLSPAAVRNLQQRLRALNFYEAGIDGIWGAQTQAALERFQRGRGLEATGQVNPATAQALGLNPNNLEAPPR